MGRQIINGNGPTQRMNSQATVEFEDPFAATINNVINSLDIMNTRSTTRQRAIQR